jgi:hypothetical protein
MLTDTRSAAPAGQPPEPLGQGKGVLIAAFNAAGESRRVGFVRVDY